MYPRLAMPDIIIPLQKQFWKGTSNHKLRYKSINETLAKAKRNQLQGLPAKERVRMASSTN